jgi:hypothetical protein
MRQSRILTALSCCLLLAGCTSDGEERDASGPSPSPTETVRRVGAYEVAGDCNGFGKLHGAQVSFAAKGELFVARPNAAVARCILDVPDPIDLEWGPEGDRLHFGDLRRFDGHEMFSIEADPESVAWSRPTGKSVVYVVDGRLMKADAFGSEPSDISFLSEHDEVVYHPAGTHVAVTGTAEDGTYGLWLATNLGEDPQLLAIGEDARRIFSLEFAHDGKTMYYAAEHDDHYDVHSLRLAVQDDEGEIRDAELGTLDSATTEMGDVVVSEFDERVAYTVGTCEENKTTRVWNGSVTELGGELANLSTEPVGWLPDGELMVIARRAGCEGNGVLYAWSPGQTTRLVAGVSVAGVRALLPPPPEPPAAKQQVVA